MSEQGIVEDRKPTVEEVTGRLNGFDEIAIEKHFGKDLGNLSGTMTLRALVFALARREGKDDREAFRGAMQKTLVECRDTFDRDEKGEGDEGNG